MSGDTRPRTRSERAYRTLLKAYPRGFRGEYGLLMAQAFGDMCREERGTFGVVRLWTRTVPDLVVSMVAERSRTVGSGLLRVSGCLTLRNLMLFNGALLLAFGFVFANAAPVGVYGIGTFIDWRDPNEYAVVAMGRLLGVVCLGFGALLIATARVAEMFVRQAVSGGLFLACLLGSLSLLGVQLAMWEGAAGGIAVAVHGFFALGYGFFWLKGSLAGTPAGGRAPAPGAESR